MQAIAFFQWYGMARSAGVVGMVAFQAKMAEMGAKPAPAMGNSTLHLFPDGSTAVTHWESEGHYSKVRAIKVKVSP